MVELDSILSSDKAFTRAQGFPIPGIGEVKVFELSLPERIQFLGESMAIDSEKDDEAFADKWVWRLLAGPDRKPAEGDIENLRKKFSYDQTHAILALGYNYGIEEAEKK